MAVAGMPEFYSLVKTLHVTTVLLSGALFVLRGLLVLGDSAWSRQSGLKRLTYANDSVLLLAGLVLMWITRQSPITSSWLAVKLTLLLVYIGLGIWALRKGRNRRHRAMFFVAAIATYLFMLSIALTRHPLGVLSLPGWV